MEQFENYINWIQYISICMLQWREDHGQRILKGIIIITWDMFIKPHYITNSLFFIEFMITQYF